MIECVTGDIFKTKADVKLIPVNVVGVMGAGLAKAFKERYPELYLKYRKDCKLGIIKIGTPAIYLTPKDNFIMFPTKEHWRNPSRVDYITKGLLALKELVGETNGIEPEWTILTPALGCGYGMLNLEEVKGLLSEFSNEIPNKLILITPPW